MFRRRLGFFIVGSTFLLGASVAVGGYYLITAVEQIARANFLSGQRETFMLLPDSVVQQNANLFQNSSNAGIGFKQAYASAMINMFIAKIILSLGGLVLIFQLVVGMNVIGRRRTSTETGAKIATDSAAPTPPTEK